MSDRTTSSEVAALGAAYIDVTTETLKSAINKQPDKLVGHIRKLAASAVAQAAPAAGPIDLCTGRPIGDHGTATQAIDYAIDHEGSAFADAFLRAWREGDLDEWPDFYAWLKQKER
jgi:hypothetical protein